MAVSARPTQSSSGKFHHTESHLNSQPSCIAWTCDGERVLVGSEVSGSACIRCFKANLTGETRSDVSKSSQLDVLAAHPTQPNQVAAALSDDKKTTSLRLVDLSSNSRPNEVCKVDAPVLALTWHPSGNEVAVLCKSNHVSVYDARHAAKHLQSRKFDWNVNSAMYYQDGETTCLLAAYGAAQRGGFRILKDSTLEPVAAYEGHLAPVHALSVTSSSSIPLLACGGDDAMLSIWNLKTMTPVRSISAVDYAVRRVSFSHDGRYLALGGHMTQQLEAFDLLQLDNLYEHRALERVVTNRGVRPNERLQVMDFVWHPTRHTVASCWDLRSGERSGPTRHEGILSLMTAPQPPPG